MRKLKSICAVAALAVIVGQVASQRRANKPRNQGRPLLLNGEPAQILVRACGNCHSDHTEWPWYSRVAPVSWWIARHVRDGKERVNFSDWEMYSTLQKRAKLEGTCGLISTGRMPPRLYAAMHPEARLTGQDKKAVCMWVKEQLLLLSPEEETRAEQNRLRR